MGAGKPGCSLGSMSHFLCCLGLVIFSTWTSGSSVKRQFWIRSGRVNSFTVRAPSFTLVAAVQGRLLGLDTAGKGSQDGSASAEGLACGLAACLSSTGPLAPKASDPSDLLSTHCMRKALWGRCR